jgi:hypothetical protein
MRRRLPRAPDVNHEYLNIFLLIVLGKRLEVRSLRTAKRSPAGGKMDYKELLPLEIRKSD